MITEITDTDVHTEHCCVIHGCKYFDPECTVVTKQKEQSFPCEDCDHDLQFGGGWYEIDLENNQPAKREMVVLKGKHLPLGSFKDYTTDPYCGWWDGEKFARWPHEYAPTHFYRLPEE